MVRRGTRWQWSLVWALPLATLFLPRPALGAQDWVARHGLSAAEFERQHEQWTRQGYRLTDVSGYVAGNSVRYAAIWENKAGPAWVARFGLSSSALDREQDQWSQRGYRLIRLNAFGLGENVCFAGIWEHGNGPPPVVRHGLTSSAFQREVDKRVAEGCRLKWISGYAQRGEARYAAIWEQAAGPAWEARHDLTSTAYQAEFEQWARQGYRPICLSGFTVGGQDRYAAIWEKSGGRDWAACHGVASAEYQGLFEQFFYQGYVPVQVVGYAGDGQGRLAAIWESRQFQAAQIARIDAPVNDFLRKYGVPGLSLAVARDGRLVFAKGYGYADMQRKIAVNPSHLFRIASMSKPITSVAIFTLIEQGKLSLNDKVFGPRGVLGDQYGLPRGFPQNGDMTVEQLLEHVGGGWPNDGHDPMFQRYDLDRADLIRWTLPRYVLPHPPGESYAYSNFGYLLLGRVIERCTGQSYEEYVKRAVMSTVGVSDMHVGGDTLAQRRPNEVLYYENGDAPYTLKVSRMDSHGGWIARPVDLLRFLVRVDGFATKPDILQPATIAAMTRPSSVNKGYAKGWFVNAAHNWWHTGALPGSYSMFVRAQNGFCWAILMNQRKTEAAFGGDVDQLGWKITGSIDAWPSYDLF